jgi:hypothetical protein
LLASGQINMRKVDGWQTFDTKPIAQPIDLAACVGGVSVREIARRIDVAASTVRETLKRFAATGLSWPLPDEMTDAVLEVRLFANAGTKQGHRRHVEPDWAAIHRKLKRKHVTLQILWDEYIEREPQGYRYSRSCELYRSWEARLSVTCARPIWAATSCSSITPAILCR